MEYGGCVKPSRDEEREWPATFEVLTASGGRHFFYRLPDGAVSAHHGAGGGVDLIFHKKGYVVGPGSVFEDGVYTVASKPPYSITVAPRWFLEIIDRVRLERRGALLAHHSSAPSSFSSGDGSPLPLNEPEWFEHGTRNDWLFAYMGRYICVDESLTELRTDFERLWQKCQWTADDPEYGQKGYQWSRHERSWYAKQEEKNNPGSLREAETVKHGHGGKRKGAGRPSGTQKTASAGLSETPWLGAISVDNEVERILHYLPRDLCMVDTGEISRVLYMANTDGYWVPITPYQPADLRGPRCLQQAIAWCRRQAAADLARLSSEAQARAQDIRGSLLDASLRCCTDHFLLSVLRTLSTHTQTISTQRTLTAFNNFQHHNVFPVAEGAWNMRDGVVITTRSSIRRLLLIERGMRIPAPTDEHLGWIDHGVPDTHPYAQDFARLRQLIDKHYGPRLVDALIWAQIQTAKLVHLTFNPVSGAGKNTICHAFQRALGPAALSTADSSEFTKFLNKNKRPSRFDEIAKALANHTSVCRHEIDGSAEINDLGVFTDENIRVEPKGIDTQILLRIGTLHLWATKRTNIKWSEQGLRQRLLVSFFADKKAELEPIVDRRLLVNTTWCTQWLTAYIFRRFQYLLDRYGSVEEWSNTLEYTDEEKRTMLAYFTHPICSHIRRVMVYDPMVRTTLEEMNAHLKEHAPVWARKAVYLAGFLRTAFGWEPYLASIHSNRERRHDGTRAKVWPIRLLQLAEFEEEWTEMLPELREDEEGEQ